MGFSVTPERFFELLMDSSESDGSLWNDDYIHPALFQAEIRERFSLIAVVLHDPKEHHDLEATLRHDFDRLDEETGHNFLFITFADIKYDAQHLSACQRVMQKYVNSTVYRSSKRMTQTTCLLFSTLLGIPIEYFPCVVLLPVSGLFQIGQSQTPKRGGWMSLRHHSVSQVLLSASRHAINYPSFNMWNFEDLLSAIEQQVTTAPPLMWGWEQRRNIRLARRARTRNVRPSSKQLVWGLFDEQRRIATSFARMSRLRNAYSSHARGRAMSKILDDFEAEDAVDLKSYLAALLKLESQGSNNRYRDRRGARSSSAVKAWLNENIHEGFQGLEVEYLEYGVRVNMESALRFSNLEDLSEYTAVVVAISKSLEIFLNGSLVQDFRERLGIPMPEFYRALYPEDTDSDKYRIEFNNGFVVDLNQEHRLTRDWKPLMLGQLKALQGRYWKRYFEEKCTINTSFEEVINMRNAATHDREITHDDAHRCLQLVRQIMQTEQFYRLSDCSKRLRDFDAGF